MAENRIVPAGLGWALCSERPIRAPARARGGFGVRSGSSERAQALGYVRKLRAC